MKHYPATMTNTLDIIERRRVYNIHMANLYPDHGATNNSPIEPCQGIIRKQELRKYYREMEFKFRDEQLQRIQRIKKQQRSKSTRRAPRNYRLTLQMIDTNELFRPDSKIEDENQNNSQIPDLEEQKDDPAETSDQIMERLGLESGMRVLDRSLSPRYSFNFKKKASIIMPDSSLSKTQRSQTNNLYYSNVQTQTLKRPKKFQPHPPDDDNYSRTAESSPRRSKASSRISESGMKDDDFEDSDKNEVSDNNSNAEQDNESNHDDQPEEEEQKDDEQENNQKEDNSEPNKEEEQIEPEKNDEPIQEANKNENEDKNREITNKEDEQIEPENNDDPIPETEKNENEDKNKEEQHEIKEPVSQVDNTPKENDEKSNEIIPKSNEDNESSGLSDYAKEEELLKNDEEDGFSSALRSEESEVKREEENERKSYRETEKRIIAAKRKRKLEESYLRSQHEGEDLMNRGLYDDSDLARDLSDARKMESDLAKEESDAQKLDSDAQVIAENLNILDKLYQD